eukprot:6187583-Pleurochrysis_carterae.AAC.7
MSALRMFAMHMNAMHQLGAASVSSSKHACRLVNRLAHMQGKQHARWLFCRAGCVGPHSELVECLRGALNLARAVGGRVECGVAVAQRRLHPLARGVDQLLPLRLAQRRRLRQRHQTARQHRQVLAQARRAEASLHVHAEKGIAQRRRSAARTAANWQPTSRKGNI